MKMSIGLLSIVISVLLSADTTMVSSCDNDVVTSYNEVVSYYPNASVDEDDMVVSFETRIEPSCVKEVDMYYPNAIVDEDSMVTSFMTSFKLNLSETDGFDLDREHGIFY